MPVSNAMDPSEWMKQKQQKPVRRSLYEALRKEANVKCFILTGLIYGCIVAIVWCRVTRVTKVDIDFTAFPITSTREISPCDDGSIYIPTAFVVMLYLLYLVECWHCKAWHQLKFEKTDLNSAYQKIYEVRQAQPVVWWKAVCYHYVRRTREITRYRNGNAYTCSQVYYERLNSHGQSGCFFYAICGMKDVSRELVNLEKHAFCKIQMSKGFLFANLEAAREFQEQRATFFQEQERHDDYMEMREGMDLSNVHFKESLISWASPDNPPWFAKIPVFWLCNFLLLSWPLRLILELNTAHVHYQVNKLFGVNYLSPSGSELLLSAPRSHGLPINNHQYRLQNRAISSHHSRLNPYNINNHRRRSTVAASERLDQEETAPLLLNTSSTNSHQDSHSHTPHQLGKNEKDELHDGSFKNLSKDQQNSSVNNENDSSTNNNNASPSSSSGRIFFPQWRSSFFSRNFRFTRQTGYKLTRSVTLLMTKPERLEFLANTQQQLPDEFGYYGDSDEGSRLLHDESYYPPCTSPPPPPFLTPSPEEEEDDELERTEGIEGNTAASAVDDNERSRLTTSSSTTTFNYPHDRNHNPPQHHRNQHHHRRNSMIMTGDQAGNNDSTNCLAPSYSQALLMEPNERSSVTAYFRNESCNPSTSTSPAPPPTANPCNSSTSPVLHPNLTNEHLPNSPNGFINVNGICNDSLGNNSPTIFEEGSTSITASTFLAEERTQSNIPATPTRNNIPSSSSLQDNCPTGTRGNPLSFGNTPACTPTPVRNDENDDLCISLESSSQVVLGDRHAHYHNNQHHQQQTISSQEQRQPCSSSSSMSSVTGHYQRASTRLANAGSSLVLNTVAPREMTGVQIDLTQPIVITVPRDPLRESAAGMVGSSISSSSSRRSTNNSTHHHHHHFPHPSFSRDDEPPTYFEALKTSRPVFLPTLARIRRCFTERDIASRFSSKKSHWLDEIADMETGTRSNHHHHYPSNSSNRPSEGAENNGNCEEAPASVPTSSREGSTSTSQV